jgi:TPR repeat protein
MQTGFWLDDELAKFGDTLMTKTIKSLLMTLVVVLGCGAVLADDFDDGMDAANKKDYVTAVKKFRLSAMDGFAEAQWNLGVSYYEGYGVVKDYPEAARWFKLAAAQGKVNAQEVLGRMYDSGRGVIQDYAESVRWYKLAAAQGNSNAQLSLSANYALGRGVVQDYIKAHMWSNLAALKDRTFSDLMRKQIAGEMTSQQIEEAQKLARECLARNYKNCD